MLRIDQVHPIETKNSKLYTNQINEWRNYPERHKSDNIILIVFSV